MSLNSSAQQLHDKATRGAPLSADEETQLRQWYALNDQQEGAMLGRTLVPDDLIALRSQVDAAATQLFTLAKQVQELAEENEARRRAIATLQVQLAQAPTSQKA